MWVRELTPYILSVPACSFLPFYRLQMKRGIGSLAEWLSIASFRNNEEETLLMKLCVCACVRADTKWNMLFSRKLCSG